MDTISWSEFENVELRVDTVIKVENFLQAKKSAYRLKLDFGPEIGIKSSSAQITGLYSKEDLLSRQVVAVVNFLPKQIGPFLSECLVTGFYQPDDKVVLAVPERPVPNCAKLA